MAARRQVPIAIVGMGAIMPGAIDVEAFWRCLLEGRDLITDVPENRWLVDDYYDPDPSAPDRTYARRGAFLPEVDFDPGAYGIMPKAMSATDPAQMLALLVADATLADVGDLASLDRERVSVILGSSQLQLAGHMAARSERPVWRACLRELGWPESQVTAACDAIANRFLPWQEATFPGLLSNVVAGRIANRFDLQGTNCCVDAACASSLAAISMGIDELALGRADVVLTGGVDAMTEAFMYLCFSKTPALSSTGDCRPFSDAADGTMLGEGVAMFALARLADAEAAGWRVHAVIRGLGSSSDGRGNAIFAPKATGQARAIRLAYAAAGYEPDTVELVEAHGTGTAAGDAAEFAALRDVFDATERQDRQWCALGSVKSQIGHTKCAAGAAGLLKAVLALQHRVLPPTIKVERPDPRLDLADSPLYLNTAARPWIASPDHPRRAAVSSFGFGGTNFHLTLEEYAGQRPARRQRAVPTELLLASGPSLEGLRGRLAGDDLSELARRSQAAFDPTESTRLAIVASSSAELRTKLDRAIALGERSVSTPDGIHLAVGPSTAGGVGLLFPGQGSQYVGMGSDLTLHLPVAKATWDAMAVLAPGLAAVVFPPPVFTDADRELQERRLTRAEWAPPALAVTSLVQLTILRQLGVQPDAVAGHSFGELVALHAAGVFDSPTLLSLAVRRAELTWEAAGGVDGAMLAVHASASEVDLTGTQDVWIANYNGPREVVVSGTVEGIASVEAALTDRGLGVRRLNTATAFHSPIVASAIATLRDHLGGLPMSSPQVEVFGNLEGVPYPVEPDAIRDCLAAQVASPVRFAATIEAMYGGGIRTFVEVGAGAVLTGMVDRILSGVEHSAVALDRRGSNGLTRLQQALGQLAVLGVPLCFAPLWDEPGPDRPKSPARTPVRINGGIHGRRYPPPGGAAALAPANPELSSGKSVPLLLQPAEGEPSPERMTLPPVLSSHSEMPDTPSSSLPLPPPSDGVSQPAEGAVVDGAWLRTIEQLHRQVAQTQEVYQRAMADGQIAFLKMAEASLAALAANHGGGVPESLPAGPGPHADPTVGAPDWSSSAHGSARDVVDPGPEADGWQAPPDTRAAAVMGAPTSAAAPTGARTSIADIVSLVMSIVADKTGYPIEVLGPDMDLETDLGIDSIKRVEILAALRDQLPDLTIEVGSDEAIALIKLRTVGEIADRIHAVLTSRTAPKHPPGEAPSSVPVPAQTSREGGASSELHGLDAWSSAPSMFDLEWRDRTGSAMGPGNGAATTPAVGMTRRVVRLVAAHAPGSPMPGLDEGPIALTDDGGGVSEALADALRDRGISAAVVHEMPENARRVILLEGLADVRGPEDALGLQRRAFRSARAVATTMEREGGLFVTVQDTGGDLGLGGSDPDRAWLGGLAALARTAAREWPLAAVKAIDCERGDRSAAAVARAILAELETGGAALDVGLAAGGARFTLEDVDTPAAPAEQALAGGGVVVVTGGARGVTAAVVRAFAERSRPQLVLLGRTSLVPESDEVAGAEDEVALLHILARSGTLPAHAKAQGQAVLAAREVRCTLADLARMQVDARYVTVDVTDRAAIALVLNDIRRDLGPITGIVHGAAVLADKRIADKTDDQFEAVFGTKVAGLQALLEETVADPLRLIVGFGSVVGRFGNPGQCDYAMANETMTQVLVAEAIGRPGCIVRSLLWGPWAGGMVTGSLAEYLRNAGVPLIPLAAGADAFCAELAAGPGPVPVLLAARSELSMTVHVSHRTHPELADHAPAGVPVLPAALVLDWFSGAAQQWCPAEPAAVLRDIRVLRGVQLTQLAAGGHTLEVRGTRLVGAGDDLLTIELHGGGPTPYYRATVGASRTEAIRWSSPPGLLPKALVYDGQALFHGPRFHCLRTVQGLSAAGAAGMVAGAAELGWPSRGRHLDPAAVDGGLQLAALWAQEVLGGPCLPMAIGECRISGDGRAQAPLRCVVRGGRARTGAAECDAALLEPDGTPIVELLAVTLVRRLP